MPFRRLHEPKHSQLTAQQLKDVKEQGGLALLITLDTHSEYVYKYVNVCEYV